VKEYLEAVRLTGKDNALALKAFFRLGQIYEDKGNLTEALNVYERILNMNLPESKYAEERINRIKEAGKQ
jgi:tetratricopeptide (TPR) repeat protein